MGRLYMLAELACYIDVIGWHYRMHRFLLIHRRISARRGSPYRIGENHVFVQGMKLVGCMRRADRISISDRGCVFVQLVGTRQLTEPCTARLDGLPFVEGRDSR